MSKKTALELLGQLAKMQKTVAAKELVKAILDNIESTQVVQCDYCDGDGECRSCSGSGHCEYCEGTGEGS